LTSRSKKPPQFLEPFLGLFRALFQIVKHMLSILII
jgi:hypothetical protein